MVDQYDLFAIIAKEGRIAIKELQERLTHKSMTPQHIYYHINKLKKKNLVTQKKGVIEIINSKKSQELYQLVRETVYCERNKHNTTTIQDTG